MDRIVISGAGVVSTFGISKGTFQENLTSNSVKEIFTGEELLPAIQEMRTVEPLASFDLSNWRSMDQLSKYATVAALQAVADAGLRSVQVGVVTEESAGVDARRPTMGSEIAPEDWGIFFGTIFGCLESNVLFNHKLLTSAPRFVSRTTFSNTVSNAAVGQIALVLQARGTQITTASGGAYPLIYAMQQLRAGRVKFALVGGMERLTPLALEGFRQFGLLAPENTRPLALDRDGFTPHEGAGALVLERLSTCIERGGQPLAELVSYGVGGNFADSMREALERGGLAPQAISLLVAQANGTKWDAEETTAIDTIFPGKCPGLKIYPLKAQLGECFGAALAFSIVAVLPHLAQHQLIMFNAASYDSRSRATFIIKKYLSGEVC